MIRCMGNRDMYVVVEIARGHTKEECEEQSDISVCKQLKNIFRKINSTITKAQTYLVEGNNSSIRDNLARFNGKMKRYTKVYKC
ncbi:hypothetical protein AGMMS50233_05480 [Endomicrobiia bacterium]|nr:hypothetical protein AGMMS50233_05480 [Endomicrobiia bacterium]